MFPLLAIATKLLPFTFAAPAACSSSNWFFFIPPWYEYIDTKFDSSCNLSASFMFPGDLLAVGLAILDILLRIAGFVAVVAIIASGVGYITAGGDVQKAASSRQRIFNALIGLVIVSIAATLVGFIGNSLG